MTLVRRLVLARCGRPCGARCATGLDRRAKLDRVADDLRSPVLYAIPSLRSDRALRVARRLGDLGAKAMPAAGGRVADDWRGREAAGVRRTRSGATQRRAPVDPRWRPGPRRAGAGPRRVHPVRRGGRGVRRQRGVPPGARASVPRGARRLLVGAAVAAPAGGRARHRPVPHRRRRRQRRWRAGRGPCVSACSTRAAHRWPFSCSSTRCSTTAPCCAPISTPDGVYLWTPASNRYGWTAYLGAEPSLDGSRRPMRCRPVVKIWRDCRRRGSGSATSTSSSTRTSPTPAVSRRRGCPASSWSCRACGTEPTRSCRAREPRGGSATRWSMPSPERSATVRRASLPTRIPSA